MYVRIFVYIYERFFYIYQKTLKKPLKIWAVWRFFLDNYAQNLASKWAVWAIFERFIWKQKGKVWTVLSGLFKKTAQKPLKIWTVFERFI